MLSLSGLNRTRNRLGSESHGLGGGILLPIARDRLILTLHPYLLALLLLPFAGTCIPMTAANASGDFLLGPQDFNFALEGKITRHSPGKLTVNAQENIVFQVRYDDKTEIKKKDGSAATAKDLRVGARVNVEGELTESGEVLALKIQIKEKSGEPER